MKAVLNTDVLVSSVIATGIPHEIVVKRLGASNPDDPFQDVEPGSSGESME